MVDPLVSIVIPAYNAELTIYDCLKSLLEQTYSNFEIIVIDDGSDDSTWNICNVFESRHTNVHVYKQKNSGIASALNYGISKAKGKYIARMDADDISLPERIEIQVRYLEQNCDVSLVSTSYIKFISGLSLETVRHPEENLVICLLLSYCSPICHPAAMLRSDVFRENKYNESIAAEDHEFWCRISIKHKLSNIDQPLLMYRISDGSLSKNKLMLIRKSTVCFGMMHFMRNFKKISEIKFKDLAQLKSKYKNISWGPAWILLFIAKLLSWR